MLFAGLAALFWLGMQRDDPDRLPSALEGRGAPPVLVTPLGPGPVLTQADLTAPGVKLVNFWASWCAPCRAEHPNLMALAAEGIPVHGINYKDPAANALAFLAELGNPFATLGADATGRTGLDWGLYGVPETFVIDADGRVILRFPGPITGRVLDETIRPAIARAAGT
jgi:cytochrome c biogenesis protein CcmG/thiol:disulfide interchange protein DsbE